MELFNSIDAITMPPNKILIEYFNKNEEIHYGSLSLKTPVGENYGNDETSSGRGRHLERMGKTIKVCDRLTQEVHKTYKGNLKKKIWNWKTDIEISEGEFVWFSSSAFYNAPKFSQDGRNFVVIDYHRLYMSENKLLNGYILCEKVEKLPESNLIEKPKTEYYNSIYRLYMRSNPVEYFEPYQEVPNDIKNGDYIMVRFAIPYPKLEEELHKFFSDKELYIFQTKEIIAKIQWE